MNTNQMSRAEAEAILKETQDTLLKIEQEELNDKVQQKQSLIEERNLLIDNAKRMKTEAIEKANEGKMEEAINLRKFAEDSEKQAREMVIEGEEPLAEQVPENIEQFGEGMSLRSVLTLLILISSCLYFLTGYINHVVQLGERDISISIGAEWIHAIQTTQFWSLCWFVSFGMLFVVFRSISKFINPKTYPELDLTTKLFTECSAAFQIGISILLLLSMVFSWALIYLHSPVSNAG